MADTVKSNRFQANSENIQKQKNFLCEGNKKHFPSPRCQRRHKDINDRPPRQAVVL